MVVDEGVWDWIVCEGLGDLGERRREWEEVREEWW